MVRSLLIAILILVVSAPIVIGEDAAEGKGELTVKGTRGAVHVLKSWRLALTCVGGPSFQIPQPRVVGYVRLDRSGAAEAALTKRFGGHSRGSRYNTDVYVQAPMAAVARIVIEHTKGRDDPARGTRHCRGVLHLRDGSSVEISINPSPILAQRKGRTFTGIVMGTEDLGELGSSEYVADASKVKEIILPKPPPATDSGKKAPAVSTTRRKVHPGTIRDWTGAEYRFDDVAPVRKTGETTRANTRTIRAITEPDHWVSSVYGPTDDVRLRRHENEVKIALDKIASIAYRQWDMKKSQWVVDVTLTSGKKHELQAAYGCVTEWIGTRGDCIFTFEDDAVASVAFAEGAQAKPRESKE